MTESDTATDPAATACPKCGTPVPAGARFCEGCGAQVDAGGTTPPAAAPPADPVDAATDDLGDAPISAPTRRPADALPDPAPAGRRPCASCGGEVGPDLYCTECGTKAPSARDHFTEQPAAWVAGVCDKGVRKHRNEDAMALLAGAEAGSRAVLVVLDGVSNSVDSDVASLAGARAAREVLRMPLPAGMGTPESRAAAVGRVLAEAAKAANTAIVAVTDPDTPNPASATLTLAVLEGTRVDVANIGDSRTYWLPDKGPGVQLTVDDSIAQEQIATGVAKEVAETGQYAHAITKWLGRDAPDISPSLGTLEVTEPGWLLACSDGLWNYASEPSALQDQIRAAGTTDPLALAQKLVDFANAAGGHDNITASLARIGPVSPPPPPPPPAAPAAGAPSPPPVQNAPTTPTDEGAHD